MEEFLEGLLMAVFPRVVEANASRDDQNAGEDDVVDRTESLCLPSHNADVFHCHDDSRSTARPVQLQFREGQ